MKKYPRSITAIYNLSTTIKKNIKDALKVTHCTIKEGLTSFQNQAMNNYSFLTSETGAVYLPVGLGKALEKPPSDIDQILCPACSEIFKRGEGDWLDADSEECCSTQCASELQYSTLKSD